MTPDNFEMFTIEGDAAVGREVENFCRGEFDDYQIIYRRVAAAGHTEVYDTAVKEAIYHALKREYTEGHFENRRQLPRLTWQEW